MINANMRKYNYYTYSDLNDYGQPALSEEVQGSLKMAIELTAQNVQSNINYTGANYVGFTHSDIDSTYVIKYGEELLKVLYVNNKGRYKQAFLGVM